MILARESERILDQGIDLLATVSVGLTRMAGSGPITLPRLCVAAACRSVERLANANDEAQRAIAPQMAEDCAAAFREGLKSIEAMLLLLDSTGDAEQAPQ